jgi:hypothetical protein
MHALQFTPHPGMDFKRLRQFRDDVCVMSCFNPVFGGNGIAVHGIARENYRPGMSRRIHCFNVFG